MKVAIVAFNSLKFCPYVRTYSDWLDKQGIDYEVIYPDRIGIKDKHDLHTYATRWNPASSKIVNFLRFKREASEILKSKRYDFVIVLTTFPAVLLSGVLTKYYKGKYIIDIRDFTHENNAFYYRREKKAILGAAMRVISASGFKCFLPESEYTFCPNIPNGYRCCAPTFEKDDTGVITIGYVGTVAYAKKCKKLIDLIVKDERFRFEIYGNENGDMPVSSYVKELGCDRIICHGAYAPEEKAEIVRKVDVLFNVYGNETMVVKHALSNKLYDSMYFKKPLLVSPDTAMSKEAGGFAFDCDFTDGMLDRLYEWYVSLNGSAFNAYGNEYLELTFRDLDCFYKRLEDVVIGNGVSDNLSSEKN